MYQHLEDLNNSVKEYFWNDQHMILFYFLFIYFFHLFLLVGG